MKRASKFLISPTWVLVLSDMGIDPSEVLAYARLPADLFAKDEAWLSPHEYFQLWSGLEAAGKPKEVPLLLAQHLSVEAFDAPLFAAVCSPNLDVALTRLSQYKPLIGPMLSEVSETEQGTEIEIHCYGYREALPKTLGLLESVFLTQIARLCTREQIQPIIVELPSLPDNLAAYESYFGCQLVEGKRVKLVFAHEDAQRPFLTSNAAMWNFFESQLNQKLADLSGDAETVERVRSVLLEALPSGLCSIEDVARKLAMSKRTLQRKLSAEEQSFQSVLQSVREELADHYLMKSRLSLGEIGFLLGFQEPNSFIRAYRSWKGISPGLFREGLH